MLPTTELRRIDAHVVCGGRWHDFDLARRELLDLLAGDERVRATVAPDYADVDRIARCELLVTYTCDVRPSADEVDHLRRWVEEGGVWLALHGTNTALDRTPDGYAPVDGYGALWALLGSHFLAHPPIAPYEVRPVSGDPLVAGIEPFTVTDELYLMEIPDPAAVTVLATAVFGGHARGFTEATWPDDDGRPVVYVRHAGAGRIWYCTLGHCRGRFDMHPEVPVIERADRGSWDTPELHMLLRRAFRWAVGPPPGGSEET